MTIREFPKFLLINKLKFLEKLDLIVNKILLKIGGKVNTSFYVNSYFIKVNFATSELPKAFAAFFLNTAIQPICALYCVHRH